MGVRLAHDRHRGGEPEVLSELLGLIEVPCGGRSLPCLGRGRREVIDLAHVPEALRTGWIRLRHPGVIERRAPASARFGGPGVRWPQQHPPEHDAVAIVEADRVTLTVREDDAPVGRSPGDGIVGPHEGHRNRCEIRLDADAAIGDGDRAGAEARIAPRSTGGIAEDGQRSPLVGRIGGRVAGDGRGPGRTVGHDRGAAGRW